MMQDGKLPRLLPADSVAAILAAIPRSGPHSPELIQGLQRWLAITLARAIRRSRLPLTMIDVDRLSRAYAEFVTVIEDLQDRNDPPPRVPVSHGSTDWDHWLCAYHVFGFKKGRREATDWKLIGALIALYQCIGGKPASAAQPTGPTMRFLQVALGVLADCAPADLRSYFAPPNAEALKKQLARASALDVAADTKVIQRLLRPRTG